MGAGAPPIAMGGMGAGAPPIAMGGMGAGAPPIPTTLLRIVTLLNTTNIASKNDSKKFFTGFLQKLNKSNLRKEAYANVNYKSNVF